MEKSVDHIQLNNISAMYEFSASPINNIAVIGMKNERNLGSILRLAVNYKASAVFIIQKRFKRSQTDTLNAAKHLPIIELDSIPTIPLVKHVYVDFSDRATPIMEFKHPKQALYIFGPEDGTLEVPPNEKAVYVPTVGSLNVAVAVGTILYDRMLQLSGIKKDIVSVEG